MAAQGFNTSLSRPQQPILKKLSISEIVQMPSKSNYELAVQNGFEGTLEEWLASLVGPPGPPGPKGESGVYIGEDPPDDVNVWIRILNDDEDEYYSDYTFLANKPTINNVELTGNLSASDLGLNDSVPLTNIEIENLINGIS